MPAYNIIYTSPAKQTYLWNGRSLDQPKARERAVLKYSGKSIKDDSVAEAMNKCREAAKQLFPEDGDPQIEKVPLKVSA